MAMMMTTALTDRPDAPAGPPKLTPAQLRAAQADFEDHAEHEYMAYVAGHPELDDEPDPGAYAAEHGGYGSLGDLLRQIGHDERVHKLASVASMSAPRFGHPGPQSPSRSAQDEPANG